MTDAHDAKVMEIAERYDLVCLVGPGVTCHEHTLCDCHVLDIIANALRDCERQTIKRAAKVAEAHKPAWDYGPMTSGKAEIDAAETTARQIAARIRALGTNDTTGGD